MNTSGKEVLHSVLFAEGMELVNVKFFPGTGRGLSADTLALRAAVALDAAQRAWESGVPSAAPCTGRKKQPLLG